MFASMAQGNSRSAGVSSWPMCSKIMSQCGWQGTSSSANSAGLYLNWAASRFHCRPPGYSSRKGRLTNRQPRATAAPMMASASFFACPRLCSTILTLEAGCRTHSFSFFITQPACSTAAVSTARMMPSNSLKSSSSSSLGSVLTLKILTYFPFLSSQPSSGPVVFLPFDLHHQPAVLVGLERHLAVADVVRQLEFFAQALGGLDGGVGRGEDVAALLPLHAAEERASGRQVRVAIEVAGGPALAVLGPGVGLVDAGREAIDPPSPVGQREEEAVGRAGVAAFGDRLEDADQLQGLALGAVPADRGGPWCGSAADGGRRPRGSLRRSASGLRSGPCGCRPGE